MKQMLLKKVLCAVLASSMIMVAVPTAELTGERVAAAESVTEDDLYYNYCDYLDNEDMEAIYKELDNAVDKIYDTENKKTSGGAGLALSAFRTSSSKDALGRLKIVVSDITKSEWTEKDIEKELAFTCIKSVGGVSGTSTKILKKVKEINDNFKDASEVLEKGFQDDADKIAFIRYCNNLNGNNRISDADYEEVIKIYTRDDVRKKISGFFSDIGQGITDAEMAFTAIELFQIQNSTIEQAKELVDSNSGLYEGLVELQKDKNLSNIRTFAEKLSKTGTFKDIAKFMKEQGIERVSSIFTGLNLDLSASTVIANAFWEYVVGDCLIGIVGGIPDAEDLLKLTMSVDNERTIKISLEEEQAKIRKNFESGTKNKVETLKNDYIMLVNMYLAILSDTVSKAEKVSMEASQRADLTDLYDMYKSQLTYNAYIKSCIKNAENGTMSDVPKLSNTNITADKGETVKLSVLNTKTTDNIEWGTVYPKVLTVVQDASDRTKVSVTINGYSNEAAVFCKVNGKSLVCWINFHNKAELSEDTIKLNKKNQTTKVAVNEVVDTSGIKWTIDNSKIASIDVSGDNKSIVVKAKTNGTAIITCLADGNVLTCKVKVKIPKVKATGYKALYKAYIKEQAKGEYPTKYKKGAFLYIDNNNTPELALTDQYGYIDLLTIYKGKVKKIDSLFDLGNDKYGINFLKKNGVSTKMTLKYVKKKNIYYTQSFEDAEQVLAYLSWNKIKNGKSSILAFGRTGSCFNGKKDIMEYLWSKSGGIDYELDDWSDRYSVSKNTFKNNCAKMMKGKKWSTIKMTSLKKLGIK